MKDFIFEIPMDSLVLEFQFNRVSVAGCIRYSVSVVDKENRTYVFNMEQRNGRWVILNSPAVPRWMNDVELQLQLRCSILENRRSWLTKKIKV